VEIIVVKEEREAGSTLVAGVVRASVSPLAGDGLDEAFGLAIGLGPVGTSEAMLEAQLAAGLGEEFGAIGGAAVGQDALNADAVSLVEVDGLVESGEDTGSFFIREEGGESQARVVIDGDVETLDASARIAMGPVAGGADAGLEKTAKLFNIKMKEFTWSGAFVTHNLRPGRIESSEAIEAMTLEDAGKGSFGDGKNHEDLGVGTTLAAEGQDLVFELWRGFARLTQGYRGAVLKTHRRAGLLSALEPLADGFLGDAESCGGGAERGAGGVVEANHFGSHERGQCGISVHSVRVGWPGVESASTTNLPDPLSADNVLKHDT
jgi:hypothetical protein